MHLGEISWCGAINRHWKNVYNKVDGEDNPAFLMPRYQGIDRWSTSNPKTI
jgi:hypothetical protein